MTQEEIRQVEACADAISNPDIQAKLPHLDQAMIFVWLTMPEAEISDCGRQWLNRIATTLGV